MARFFYRCIPSRPNPHAIHYSKIDETDDVEEMVCDVSIGTKDNE